MSIAEHAERVDAAAREARAIAQFPEGSIDTETAYAIQATSIANRIERGERLVGVKMGFTSRAKMAQMGIDQMIWGRLTSGMLVEEGGDVDLVNYVHPRVEPEVAFLLARPLTGRVTPAEAQAALSGVAPALEIIDSRYDNFRFSLPDVIADNSSSSGFVVGPWSPPDTDVSTLGMVMSFNGQAVAIGSSAAILGHPIRSLVAAAAMAGEAGITLEPGFIVLAGGATAAEPLRPGVRVSLAVEQLGAVSFRVRGAK